MSVHRCLRVCILSVLKWVLTLSWCRHKQTNKAESRGCAVFERVHRLQALRFARGILTGYTVWVKGDMNSSVVQRIDGRVYSIMARMINSLNSINLPKSHAENSFEKSLTDLCSWCLTQQTKPVVLQLFCQLCRVRRRGSDRCCVLDLLSFSTTAVHYWLLIFIALSLALHNIAPLSVRGQRGPAVEIWQCERLMHQTRFWLHASFNHAPTNMWWLDLIHL